MDLKMQNEITKPAPLLGQNGTLNQVGWSRQPLLDCNLEKVNFYPKIMHPLQFLRVKRWDYYAVFTPDRFFSATIADLGYAGNIFVYTLDFESHELHEEGLVVPLSKGIRLPRSSTSGESIYEGKSAQLRFVVNQQERQIMVDWPGFHDGRGIKAELYLSVPADHETMTIVIPIEGKRFYYNTKINCIPTSGTIQYGDINETLDPTESLASLDWGRGVWAYSSFWNWASASGFLTDGRTIGLNLGCGFGDTSAATEDCFILNGEVHKLENVSFDYQSDNYLLPWKFLDSGGNLVLEFSPFKDRVAKTNLGIINSEVHQLFGRYNGWVKTRTGEVITISNLIGFAEEHLARW